MSGYTPATPNGYLAMGLALATGTISNALKNVAYEFIFYNRVLSASERKVVHRYLGNRYGISVP